LAGEVRSIGASLAGRWAAFGEPISSQYPVQLFENLLKMIFAVRFAAAENPRSSWRLAQKLSFVTRV
jgi:hypothetical protein